VLQHVGQHTTEQGPMCTQAYIKHSSYMTAEMLFFQTHTMGSLQIKKATFSYILSGVTAHVAGTKPFPYLLEILSYMVIIVSGPL
jgi:hypothetical protein